MKGGRPSQKEPFNHDGDDGDDDDDGDDGDGIMSGRKKSSRDDS